MSQYSQLNLRITPESSKKLDELMINMRTKEIIKKFSRQEVIIKLIDITHANVFKK